MAHNVQHSVTVTGVPAQGGAQPNPYPRRPIEELVTDQKQFSLYVQATGTSIRLARQIVCADGLYASAAMQSTTSQNMLSWFQVSGIHGLPETPWDNVAGINNPPWVGYCTHSSVLFPTWHRPYVLLFEVRILNALPLFRLSSNTHRAFAASTCRCSSEHRQQVHRCRRRRVAAGSCPAPLALLGLGRQ